MDMLSMFKEMRETALDGLLEKGIDSNEAKNMISYIAENMYVKYGKEVSKALLILMVSNAYINQLNK